MDCTNFDIVNGPLYDLSDTFVFDRLERRLRAGGYAAVFGSPDAARSLSYITYRGFPHPLPSPRYLAQNDTEDVTSIRIPGKRFALRYSSASPSQRYYRYAQVFIIETPELTRSKPQYYT